MAEHVNNGDDGGDDVFVVYAKHRDFGLEQKDTCTPLFLCGEVAKIVSTMDIDGA